MFKNGWLLTLLTLMAVSPAYCMEKEPSLKPKEPKFVQEWEKGSFRTLTLELSKELMKQWHEELPEQKNLTQAFAKSKNSKKFTDICAQLKQELKNEVSSSKKVYELIGKLELIKKIDEPCYCFNPISTLDDYKNNLLTTTAPNKIENFIKDPCFAELKKWCEHTNDGPLLATLGIIFFDSQKGTGRSLANSDTKYRLVSTAHELLKSAKANTGNSILSQIPSVYISHLEKKYPELAPKKLTPVPTLSKEPLLKQQLKKKTVKIVETQKKTLPKKENNPLVEVYQQELQKYLKQKNYTAAAECAWQLAKEKKDESSIKQLEDLSKDSADSYYYLVDFYKDNPAKVIEYFLKAEKIAYAEKKPFSKHIQNKAVEILGILDAAGHDQIPHIKATHYYYEFKNNKNSMDRIKSLQLSYEWANKSNASKDVPSGCIPLHEIESALGANLSISIMSSIPPAPTSYQERFARDIQNRSHIESARKILNSAIKHGSIPAMHNLALFHLSRFLECSQYSLLIEAISLLINATQNNLQESAAKLEELCTTGIIKGIPLPPSLRRRAIDCLKKQTCYDSSFNTGNKIKQVATNVFQELLITFKNGNSELEKAIHHFDIGEYEQSLALLEKLDAENNWRASIFLHEFYINGTGNTKPSTKKAVDCLQAIFNKKLVDPVKNEFEAGFIEELKAYTIENTIDQIGSTFNYEEYVKLYKKAQALFDTNDFQDGIDCIYHILKNAVKDTDPTAYAKFAVSYKLLPENFQVKLNDLVDKEAHSFCAIDMQFLMLAHNLYVSKLPAHYDIFQFPVSEKQICDLHPILGPTHLAQELSLGIIINADVPKAINYISHAIKNLGTIKEKNVEISEHAIKMLKVAFKSCQLALDKLAIDVGRKNILISLMQRLEENLTILAPEKI